ncbi:hypothetical protein [Actinoplanes derwentensis]|uniref:Condensation domain-containing protein n=1 Tax=Actinoplanes derwentensis TaxID=113562 RepID=A0A1H2DDD8_9ACTN|nr:hypothetical protein [Actinoplanes derwentensis]GID90131.1 hypothetical protein Ade03nite_90550 [Actinoplanes derwentensis]SDT80753.1 hypothetical protein SAMN04489716_9342 [Actinoplanes derwentensis]
MSAATRDLAEVRLHGAGTGPFPLSWGQGNMWESILALGPEASRFNLYETFPLNRSPGVGEAVSLLDRCLNRFDAFRLVFDASRAQESFHTEVRLAVPVSELPPGPVDPYTVDAAALSTGPFDLREPPIRVGLLHRGGRVTHASLVLSHLPFDGASFEIVKRHVTAALEGCEPSAPGLSTGELLRYESSEAGVRRSDAVIGRWVAAARSLPPGRGLMPTTPGSYSVTALRSDAVAIAAQVLARRLNVSTTSVVLAGLSQVITRDVDPGLGSMLMVCNNRWQRQLGDFAGQTLGNGLLRLPREDDRIDFPAYLKAVHLRAVLAYRHARYDSLAWRRTLTSLAARGESADFTYYFNDVRMQRGTWDGLEDRAGELSNLRERTEPIRVVARRDRSDATLFANLHDGGRTCVVDIVCDDDRVPPDQAAAVLASLQDLLVEAAAGS